MIVELGAGWEEGEIGCPGARVVGEVVYCRADGLDEGRDPS
jgi:hypothetical protein